MGVVCDEAGDCCFWQVTFVEYVRQSGGWDDCLESMKHLCFQWIADEAGSVLTPKSESGFIYAESRHTRLGCAQKSRRTQKKLRTFQGGTQSWQMKKFVFA